MNRFDPQKEQFTAYHPDLTKITDSPTGLLSDSVWSIHQDSEGMLWIGTSQGLNQFDPRSGQFLAYQHDPDDPHSLSGNTVTVIHEDRAGTLWFGTLGDGLNRFDPESERFVQYRHDPADPQSLGGNTVWAIHEDSEGVLWIGTSAGLDRLEPDERQFTHYGEGVGLPGGSVMSVLEDDTPLDQGGPNLWLSTSSGLYKFDPRTETLRRYDVGDGLQGNEFAWGSAFKSASGELFFGGSNGLTAFYPDQILDSPHLPPIVLTDLQLANKPVSIGSDGILLQSIAETKHLTLSHEDRVISFELAALGYRTPQKSRYRYLLEGFDEDWTEVGSDHRFVTYTNLDPGEYVFRVTGSNSDRVWNEEGTSLKITITPPWWQTTWAYGLLLILAVAGLYGAYRWRVRSLATRSRELETLVAEKTRQVDERVKELNTILTLSQDVVSTLELEPLLSQDRLSAVFFAVQESPFSHCGPAPATVYWYHRNPAKQPKGTPRHDCTARCQTRAIAEGGLMLRATRQQYPRIAEVPFDSAYKLMATFHNMVNPDGDPVVRCYVKGAPDVLIARSASILGSGGTVEPLAGGAQEKALEFNEQLASQGKRVMVVAGRDLDPATFDPEADLLQEVNDLTLLGMVGIIDPSRPEAKAAIAECISAGIRVRMITGDHAVTAAAIAGELGIEGRAITGAEWAAMSDEEAATQIDDIGVIARVAPEDKIRLVKTLKEKNNIVAMTGDGVNDAPALKTADIGVAMGITGTDVSKGAVVMILADDNFATIVGAVHGGRIIYDNLLKYLRFQMASLLGFILAFLGASALGVTLMLFTPLQILFVNWAIQMPIGASLGFDSPTPGLMKRKLRPADEKILTWPLAIRLFIVGLIAALLSILAYQWTETTTGSTTAAQTMAMVMFSILAIPISIGLRHPTETLFRAETFSNRQLWLAYGWILLILVLVTELPLLQEIFETESLTPQQWGICLVAAVLFLFAGEIARLIPRVAPRRPQ